MNFVALGIIPEAHLCLAVVAVNGGELVRIPRPCVYAVLPQHAIITAVSVEEQPKST